MKRWKLTVEYVGTDYFGWQRQEGELPTIQKSIEDAITRFCQQEIRVHVAGRTDAGVHAYGQICHFDLDYGDRDLGPTALINALNAHLRPQPIAVVNAEIVPDDFHARFSAHNKLYQYRVLCRPFPPTMDRGRVWYIKHKLDIEAMRESAKHLLGTHDFTSFRDSQCQAKSPVKTLDKIEIITKPYDNFGGTEVCFSFEAQSFLHHQVRNMVGTLVLVGEGKWQAGDIKTALEAQDRNKGGPTAPAAGLYLIHIDY